MFLQEFHGATADDGDFEVTGKAVQEGEETGVWDGIIGFFLESSEGAIVVKEESLGAPDLEGVEGESRSLAPESSLRSQE